MPTKHDKARLVAQHFNDILAMQVQEVVVDTDIYGTFSGEIERVGTPLETAVKKARLGIETTSNPFAIASEGSVVPHLSAMPNTRLGVNKFCPGCRVFAVWRRVRRGHQARDFGLC